MNRYGGSGRRPSTAHCEPGGRPSPPIPQPLSHEIFWNKVLKNLGCSGRRLGTAHRGQGRGQGPEERPGPEQRCLRPHAPRARLQRSGPGMPQVQGAEDVWSCAVLHGVGMSQPACAASKGNLALPIHLFHLEWSTWRWTLTAGDPAGLAAHGAKLGMHLPLQGALPAPPPMHRIILYPDIAPCRRCGRSGPASL